MYCFQVYEQSSDDIDKSSILHEFATAFPDADLTVVFGEDSDYDGWRLSGRTMLDRLGLGDAPQVLINGVPLHQSDMDPDTFEEAIVSGILKVTPDIQKAAYNVSGILILTCLVVKPEYSMITTVKPII